MSHYINNYCRNIPDYEKIILNQDEFDYINVFYLECDKLNEVKFKSVTTIKNYTFYGSFITKYLAKQV